MKKNTENNIPKTNAFGVERNLMSLVISLPAIFIVLLLVSGIYGQYLGRKVSSSLNDVYIKVVSPLVNFQAITAGMNTLTINLLVVQNSSPNALDYERKLLKIKSSIIELDQLIEAEISSAKGRPYENIINSWEPEWEKFYLEIKDNSTKPNYLKNNMPRLLLEIEQLGQAMGSIDNIIKISVGDILEGVDDFMLKATRILSLIQLFGLILGVLITIPIVRIIRRLIKATHKSKKNMESLLNNLDQGFLVYSHDGEIASGATKAATTLFGKNPAGLNLHQLLQVETTEEKNNIENWLKILFSGQLPFSEAKQWGPRSFTKREGVFVALDYRPIFKSSLDSQTNELEAVICIASDKTHEKELQKNIEKEQARINFIATVAMGREMFWGFVKETRANFTLSVSECGKDAPDLEIILRYLHNIKGNAQAFKMIEIANQAHQLESQIVVSFNNKEQSDMKYFQLTDALKKLAQLFEKYLQENKELIGEMHTEDDKKYVHIKEMQLFMKELDENYGSDSLIYKSFMNRFVLEDLSSGFKIFEKVVDDVAFKLGKNVKLNIYQSGISVCLMEYSSLLSDCVHLFRNAVDHGIEDEVTREEIGKKPQATISVSFVEIQKSGLRYVQILVEDDGAGINAESILEKCVSQKLLTKEEAASLTKTQIIQYIFKAGFTSRDIISETSGRGVGLDAVKVQAEELGGNVHVETELGKWTRFIIEVPVIEKLQIKISNQEASHDYR